MTERVIARNTSLFALARRRIFAMTRRFFPSVLSVRQVSVGSLQILVFANEYLGRRLMLSKTFEAEELAALSGLLKPGDVVFDIGANIGFMAANFGKLVGPGGRVHAFEPVERNALLARLSALINGFDHVLVHQRAVSHTAGRRLAQVNVGADSAAAYFSESGTGGGSTETVTIDTAREEFQLSRIDFIKIDVEGFEFDVLKGAQMTLADRSTRPRLMMIEIVEEYLHRAGATASDIYAFLASHGYQARLLKNGRMIAIASHDAPPGNIFFVLEEDGDRGEPS